MTRLDVRISGPIFFGQSARIMERFGRELVGDLIDEATRTVVENQYHDFKEPSGNYWSNMKMEWIEMGPGVTKMLYDQGVIYGPWLEGTGSRNASTRFKGYWAWRRSFQDLLREFPKIATKVIDRTLRKDGLTS